MAANRPHRIFTEADLYPGTFLIQSSVGRQALARFRIEEVRLIDGEREPDRFVFADSQPLLKNGHDLRLTRVRDQMRFRTRRFDEGDDAGKSSIGVQPNAFRPDAEYDSASSPAGRRRAD